VIGRDGQEKLEAAMAVVPRGFAGSITARYLSGAGVGRVREGDVSIDDARFADLDPAARDVALGAHAAATAIMKIIGT
jgi:hypothetical protein